MTKALDITNKTYGKLTAIMRTGRDANGHALWLLRCECGGQHTARVGNLESGRLNNCPDCSPAHRGRRAQGFTLQDWHYLTIGDEIAGALPGQQGAAGFCVVLDTDSGREIVRTKWIERVHDPRHTHPAVLEAVLMLRRAGHIAISGTRLSVRNWLRGKRVDHQQHSYIERGAAGAAFDEFYRLTGEWRGAGPAPYVEDSDEDDQALVDEPAFVCDAAESAQITASVNMLITDWVDPEDDETRPTLETTPGLDESADTAIPGPSPAETRAAARARLLAEIAELEGA